jgi:CheY-like chemotaxis protein
MATKTQSPIAPEHFAAESRDARNQQEPDLTIDTSPMASTVMTITAVAPKAETGLSPALDLENEGLETDERQDAPRATGEAQAMVKTDRKPMVLLVEDTMELAEVIQAALTRANVDTIHESHGGKALIRYPDLKPDLILLDIGLPDITGWQFLEGIKERHKNFGTNIPPVVVISAYGDPANRLVGKFQGVYDYLIKPFTAAEVERVVTKALATHGA